MGKDSISSDRMGLFWTMLDTCKFDKALKCISSDFQPHALHPENRTTLLAEAIGAGLCTTSAEQQQCLELIQALRDRGASWTQACKSPCTPLELFKTADPKNSRISVRYGTHTALSFTQAWLRKLHEKKGWEEEVSHLHKVLEIYFVEPQPSRTKLAIDEGIVSKLRRSQVLLFIRIFFLARFPYDFLEKNSIPHHCVWKAIPYSLLDNSLLLMHVDLVETFISSAYPHMQMHFLESIGNTTGHKIHLNRIQMNQGSNPGSLFRLGSMEHVHQFCFSMFWLKSTNNSNRSTHAFYKLLVEVDLWEKLLLATGSHDLTIDTAEGPVTAHAQMLKEASPAPWLGSYPRKPCDPIVLFEQISRVSGC